MIIVRLSGGMGNQMFQYAVGRALSLKHGAPLGLDTTFLLDRTPREKWFVFRNYDLDIFNILAKIIPQSEIPFFHRKLLWGKFGIHLDRLRRKLMPGSGTEKGFHFDPTIMSLGPNAYLEGYWQSPKYFESIRDVLLADFKLREDPQGQWKWLQQKIKNSESVCVHIRRTDFVANPLHDVYDKKYYDDAIAHIAQSQKIETLYVFSDDSSWCEQNLSFPYPTVFVGDEYRGQKNEGHLMLMSACNHFVIANSSFSWWAAWLSDRPDKIVVAPKKWFVDETINSNDLIPDSWIRI